MNDLFGKEEAPGAVTPWFSYVNPTSTATVNYSVADDGVCTVNIGGAPDDWPYEVGICYNYPSQQKANKAYKYEFEAWTQSDNRILYVSYYYDMDTLTGLDDTVLITSARQTYNIYGEMRPKDGNNSFDIHCGDQTGTFYVRMISITEYDPSTLPNPDNNGNNDVDNPDDGDEPIVTALTLVTTSPIDGEVVDSGKGWITGAELDKVKNAAAGSKLRITLTGTENLNWGSIGAVGVADMGDETNRVDFAPKSGGTYTVEVDVSKVLALSGIDDGISVNVWGNHVIDKVELVEP